jgi:DNA polymerase family B, exonuclease domain
MVTQLLTLLLYSTMYELRMHMILLVQGFEAHHAAQTRACITNTAQKCDVARVAMLCMIEGLAARARLQYCDACSMLTLAIYCTICMHTCMYTLQGVFPEADKDPVIQIANAVSVTGREGLIVKNVFTLNGCDQINGAHVIPNDTEAKLLMG